MNNILGYRTTTINIVLTAGVFSYKFSNNKFLGLPRNANIISITYRNAAAIVGQRRAINGGNLARFGNSGLLTLKSKNNQTNLLNNHPIILLEDALVSPFSSVFLEPIKNDRIDWLASFISFPSQPVFTTGEVIELTVLYTIDCKEIDLSPKNIFYSGSKFMGIRTTLLTIVTTAGIDRYELSFNNNIEIPKDAYIIGLTTFIQVSENGFPPVNINVEGSSFLTIKVGTDSIINELPYNYRVNPALGVPYIPIQPILANEFDAQNSNIVCSNAAAIVSGQTYNILLWYVCNY